MSSKSDAAQEKKREMRKQERAKLKSQEPGEWTTIPIKSREIQAKINEVDDEPIVKIPRFVWADE